MALARDVRTDPVLDRPVIIMAPPRSGTTLLFDLLARSPGLSTIGGESHQIIESIANLHPRQRGWESNRLTAEDADPETVRRLTSGWLNRLRYRDGRRPALEATVRMLEKTPRNCLRLPFLAAAFPDARFIYLFREPRETVSSMLDAWRSRRFISYPELPGWTSPPWSLLLVPGWRGFAGKELAEIVARQWAAATACVLADLDALPSYRWCVASYDRLIAEPQETVQRLCAWIGVDWTGSLTTPLPPSRSILTPPQPDKWQRNREEIERVIPLVDATAGRSQRVRNREG